MEKRISPQISITMSQHVLDELDRLSKKMGINRSKLISNILEMGVGDVKVLEKVGMIDLAVVVRNFQNRTRRELRLA